MRVFVLLPDAARRRFTAAAPRGAILQLLPGPTSLAMLAQAEPGSLMVLDPTILTERQADGIAAQLERLGVPLLLYLDARIDCASRVLSIACHVETEVLFHGVPEEQAVLSRLIDNARDCSASSLMLVQLRDPLTNLRGPLLQATVSLFGWSPVPESVRFFCRNYPGHRRTVEREIVRAGFRGVGRLLDGARLAQAWTIAESQPVVDVVASRAGYHSERMLTSHSERFVGLSFRRACRSLSTAEFARCLAESV